MTKIKSINKNSAPKRVKRELEYNLKEQLIKLYNEKKAENPKYTQKKFIIDIKPIIGYEMPATTASDLLSNKDIILKMETLSLFRDRKAKYPELEEVYSYGILSFWPIMYRYAKKCY